MGTSGEAWGSLEPQRLVGETGQHHRADPSATMDGMVDDVSREQFEILVDDAIATIPAALRRAVSNVSIEVADRPPPGQNLFGLYQGIPLTRRGNEYNGAMPDRIWIYRETILRYARTEADVVEQVRTTVLHEIAHHFGIDDAQLHELGYG
jgi:predicted Zn-dependent protease with MMP-like domain